MENDLAVELAVTINNWITQWYDCRITIYSWRHKGREIELLNSKITELQSTIWSKKIISSFFLWRSFNRRVNNEEEVEIVSDEEVLPDSNFKNYLKSAKNSLKEFLKLRNLNSEEVKKAVSLFNKFMEDPQPFEDYMIGNDNFSWTQIKCSEEGWSDIADIAERLLSCVTSEASCERTKRFSYFRSDFNIL